MLDNNSALNIVSSENSMAFLRYNVHTDVLRITDLTNPCILDGGNKMPSSVENYYFDKDDKGTQTPANNKCSKAPQCSPAPPMPRQRAASHSGGTRLAFHPQHLLQLHFGVVRGGDLVPHGARVLVYLVVIATLVCLVPKEVNRLEVVFDIS